MAAFALYTTQRKADFLHDTTSILANGSNSKSKPCFNVVDIVVEDDHSALVRAGVQ
jgi:hypothetical protein